MDTSSLLYGGVATVVIGLALLYIALVLWSPPPIVTHDSEKKYRTHLTSKGPLPLTPLSDPSNVDLTVIIPAYNETERLPTMMEAAVKHLSSKALRHRTYEIIIVDDGSTDTTVGTSLKLTKKYAGCDIKVVSLEKNLGKGGAVRHGMLYGGGKRLLMVDADGASRFEDLEGLWKAMDGLQSKDEEKPAIAIGSRAHLVRSEAVVKVCTFMSIRPEVKQSSSDLSSVIS
ncbi:hypothetical protein AX16_008123 [Volvariella volvacea WC 439]|nr:hypothetical protein AX16_008123 [Volvariella volvacea WC 439]